MHLNAITLPVNPVSHSSAEVKLIQEAMTVLQLLPHDAIIDETFSGDASIARLDTIATHLTASSVVFDTVMESVLLLRRDSLLIPLGGHVEACDASLLSAAARELYEETGLIDVSFAQNPIDVDLHKVSEPEHANHLDFRFLASASHIDVVSGDESDNAFWLRIDEARNDKNIGHLISRACAIGVDGCSVSLRSMR